MTSPTRSRRISGIGRVLVVVYAIMALAATAPLVRADRREVRRRAGGVHALCPLRGRLHRRDDRARPPGSRRWYPVAWVAISFELVGVLVIGTLSVVLPGARSSTPPSGRYYGIGYLFIPLVLPFFGSGGS